MSHFSVLVITQTKPSQDELHQIMLPWHEYECTGYEEYVIDVDVTDEMVAAHAAHGDGEPFTPKWVKEWSGAKLKDGRYYKHTNPNKKWDWYQIGGRWTGMLVPYYDPEKDSANRETCTLCNGTGKRADMPGQDKCNGCAGTGIHTKRPTQWAKIAGDQLRLGDIPLVTLRDEAERRALDKYDEATGIVGGRPIPDWATVLAAQGTDYAKAREIYNNDPVIVALQEKDPFLDSINSLRKSRADVARSARASAICPFAIVHEGKWYERGEMGWWACVSNEKDRDAWAEEFEALLDKLSPDSWLTVVDCHI